MRKVTNAYAINGNLGDIASSPCRYFNEGWDVDHVHLFAPEEVNSDLLILGGGGIWHDDEIILKWMKVNRCPVVVWGAGNNTHWTQFETDEDGWGRNYRALRRVDLSGVRDKSDPIWADGSLPGDYFVPCASCMHPIFEQVEHDTVVQSAFYFYHHEIEDPLSRYVMPSMDNSLEDLDMFDDKMEMVVGNMASSNVVITNSYHGAYWAALVGRHCVVVEPFSTKFFSIMGRPPFFATRRNFLDVMDQVMRLKQPDPTYKMARDYNKKFYSKVKELRK